MKEILQALYSLFSSSSLFSSIGGRLFLDQTPDGCEFPYVVYSIVSGVPDKTFTEHYTETLIQFSLFSSASSAVEITTMYADLKSLFDECSLTITGSTLVWMREQNLVTMTEDITAPDGSTQRCRHWAIDFEVRTSLS